uniref:CRM1_C domain-containing protein n=2 Tax=Caenorhabditis tropicalis TaxID=1561998 RepID=A0A1I7UQG6_9PELO
MMTKHCLDILKELLARVSEQEENISQPFYKNYYIALLKHVLAVACDSSQVHVAGLTYYAEVLCALFRAPEFSIKVPLNQENPQQGNIDYIYETVGRDFQTHFENMNHDQIRIIIKGFFSFNTEIASMRNHLRDFLIQIKEHNGEDTSDLYLEEREAEIQQAQQRKRAVPGILKPDEVDDEDMR